MGLTLLAHAPMPLHLWGNYFSTPFNVINRIPSIGLPTLYLLYLKLPSLESIKVFGCACFPLTRPYTKHKLDFKSQECIYLGVSSQHKRI